MDSDKKDQLFKFQKNCKCYTLTHLTQASISPSILLFRYQNKSCLQTLFGLWIFSQAIIAQIYKTIVRLQTFSAFVYNGDTLIIIKVYE